MKFNKYDVFDLIDYDPHHGQKTVHDSSARFKLVNCGRRWGKSQLAGHEMTAALIDPANKGNTYWIVGPTYELGEREFEVVYNDIMKLPIARQCDMGYTVRSGNMVVKMPWGTECRVVSATNPKSLQGKGLSGVIMSEAATHAEDTWAQYIRPALSDHRGWALFPSTPKGFNWFYEYYMRGTDPKFPDWDAWTFPTWTNDKVFSGADDPEILEAKHSMSPMMFDQEYGAQFTTFEGQIFPEFDPAIHVKEIKFNTEWRNYWAFDFGYRNPFVCLDIMVDPSDNVYVWREYYEKFQIPEAHARAIMSRKNPSGFHVDGRFGDPADPGAMAALAPHIGTVFGERVSWIEGVESIKSHLTVRDDGKPRLFIHPRCTNLIREMAMLRVIGTTVNLRDPKEGQHKYNDHAPDALRYFMSSFFVLGMGGSLGDIMKWEESNSMYDAFETPDLSTFFNLPDSESGVFTLDG